MLIPVAACHEREGGYIENAGFVTEFDLTPLIELLPLVSIRVQFSSLVIARCRIAHVLALHFQRQSPLGLFERTNGRVLFI